MERQLSSVQYTMEVDVNDAEVGLLRPLSNSYSYQQFRSYVKENEPNAW